VFKLLLKMRLSIPAEAMLKRKVSLANNEFDRIQDV
jgi:hypothetical protein